MYFPAMSYMYTVCAYLFKFKDVFYVKINKNLNGLPQIHITNHCNLV